MLKILLLLFECLWQPALAEQGKVVLGLAEGMAISDVAGREVRALYAGLGLEVEFKPLPLARSVIMADAGELDGETVRTAEVAAHAPHLIQVPEPLLIMEYRAVSTGRRYDSWEALEGKRLCISVGRRVLESRTRGYRRTLTRNDTAALKMLQAGRCDAVVSDQFIPLDAFGPARALCEGEPLETVPLFHYVHERHADLVSPLASLIRERRKNGGEGPSAASRLALAMGTCGAS